MCHFSTLTVNSLTPSRCPVIQLNSDTVYLELAIRSHKFKGQSRGTADRVPRHPYFCLTNCSSGGSHWTLPRFNNSVEWLAELREVLYLIYWFIMKDIALEQLNRRNAWSKILRNGVVGAELPCPLQAHTLIYPPTQKLSKPNCLGVFMEASLYRFNWLNYWPLVIELRL